MSRRTPITIAALALALASTMSACGVDLEDELEGEPCTVEDDCWRTQECFRTPEEAALEIPGLCLPEGSLCVYGQQLGCECSTEQPSANCSAAARPTQLSITYPRMVCDPALLRCTLAPPEGGTSP